MSQQQSGLPPIPQGLSLDDAAVQACSEDIGTALKKYNCSIVYEQILRNGLPMGPGQFRVLKNPPEDKPRINVPPKV